MGSAHQRRHNFTGHLDIKMRRFYMTRTCLLKSNAASTLDMYLVILNQVYKDRFCDITKDSWQFKVSNNINSQFKQMQSIMIPATQCIKRIPETHQSTKARNFFLFGKCMSSPFIPNFPGHYNPPR